MLAVRIAENGIAAINSRAQAEGVDRSELIRRMFAYALRTMPKGWKP